MREVGAFEAKNTLGTLLDLVESNGEEIVITRHGKPAGVLIGFRTEDDWFEYRLQSDPRFLARVESARASIRGGRAIPLEDVPE